ncbi:LysR family transcriptional regulator [Paraburkholderia terrae]|nr:LysR family transcriptional regulator [Paraburkholderia terrae]
MSRAEINRLAEMEVFVQAVDSGGLSAAARRLSMTPSAVSKLVSRLEVRLGTRLLVRSTKGIELTAEGQSFYLRCLSIIEEVAAAEREATRSSVPQGRLRVSCNVPFGTHYLLPLIPKFLARYPKVQLDVALTDRVIDLMEEKTDVAIRTGVLADSGLISRKLGASELITVAAPSYVDTHGMPPTPRDLQDHHCLGFSFARHASAWAFVDRDGERLTVMPACRTCVHDGESMRLLALGGVGIARLALFHVAKDLRAGRLLRVLEEWSSREVEPVHAVFVGPGKMLAPRVRAFLDFLVDEVVLPVPDAGATLTALRNR